MSNPYQRGNDLAPAKKNQTGEGNHSQDRHGNERDERGVFVPVDSGFGHARQCFHRVLRRLAGEIGWHCK